MIKQSLQIKYNDGGVAKTFPEGKKPAVIGTFTYEAQRMGSAPTISATLYYPECLDAKWSGKEYVEFRGTKYYAFRKPVSSKSNDTFMYKHEVQFVDERIVLDNTFFLDVVTASTKTAYKDRYRSNTTKFSFMGTLAEFVARVNDSMVYSGLCTYSKDASTGVETWNGYHIVIDEGVSTDETVEVKVEETYLVDAIQEIYNSFKLNYYWVGKTCHVGNFQNAVGSEKNPLKYQKGLLSVNVSDTNNKIFDRITGVGSSENIPYYYPNDTPNGYADFEVKNTLKSYVSIETQSILEYNSKGMLLDTWYLGKVNPEYTGEIDGSYSLPSIAKYIELRNHRPSNAMAPIIACSISVYLKSGANVDISSLAADIQQTYENDNVRWICGKKDLGNGNVFYVYDSGLCYYDPSLKNQALSDARKLVWMIHNGEESFVSQNVDIIEDGFYTFQLRYLSGLSWKLKDSTASAITDWVRNFMALGYTEQDQVMLEIGKQAYSIKGKLKITYKSEEYFFEYGEDNKKIEYSKSGITITDISTAPAITLVYSFVHNEDSSWSLILSRQGSRENAVQIKILERTYITPSAYLMPSIYRSSQGSIRFYDAKNNTYTDSSGNYITFANPYVSGNPHEGKQDFSDIKPSIKDVENEDGELFGVIDDVAFDSKDNDLLKADGETYQHSYFYIKLKKFNGDFGFDLFAQAIENETMKIEMTSGSCAACKFEIGSVKFTSIDGKSYEFVNPVHVDENGDLQTVSDSGDSLGDFLLSSSLSKDSYDKIQQSTFTNSIWIAVKKDNSTYGEIMPNAKNRYLPKAGDKFVITGIKMPSALVLAAENRLDKALIQYMKENNDVVTSMSVTFSRNWLNANSSLVSLLNENAKVRISYDNKDYDLFVSNYTCRADENILYDITVELSAKLSVSNIQSVSQSSGLASQFVGSIGGVQLTQIDIDELRTLLQDSFLSKDDMATITGKFNDLFLSKTEKDTANGNITFNKGIVAKGSLYADNVMNVGAADYSPNGVGTNSGVEMTADGTIKAKRLELGESMVVPSIQYNNAEWVGGNTWRSAGGGVVKNCVEYNNKYLLMLEVKDGEAGKIAVGDKCQGIYHKISGNSSTDSDGHNGHFTFKGFTTIYFQVEELITGFSEGETFNVCDALGITKYELSTYLSRNAFAYVRPRSALDSTYTDSTLPQPQMNFAVYANNGNSARQQVCLETPKYTIYLSGMTNWTYGESNIQLIVGSDLSGFTINRTKWDVAQGKYVNADPIALSGAGMAIGNLYQWGNIKQFDRKPTLVSQQIHFLANTSTVAPEKTDANWDKTGTKATKALPYLWCYYTYTYSDGQTSSSDVFLSANFASDGTSVKILGSFNTKAELETAYANQQLVAGIGNGYMVQADGHLWSFVVDAYSGVFADDIKDMGQIKGDKGDQGAKGDNGKDVIDVKIYTNTGQFRIEKNGTITLTAEVYKGEENITSSFSALDFSWTRESDHTDLDAIWNAQHVGVGRTITIGNDDIDRKAAFNCIINI